MEKINIGEMDDMYRRGHASYMAHEGHIDRAGHSRRFARVGETIYYLDGREYIPLDGSLETWLEGI